MPFDSRPDTLAHIARVRELLTEATTNLIARAAAHDASKLEEPEKETFDRCTPALNGTEYDSPEYEAAKAMLGDALAHHYAANDHHPEHFARGIHDMTLVQLLEMLADWKAAGERHDDGGDLERSIRVNANRFAYGPETASLLLRTAQDLGWA